MMRNLRNSVTVVLVLAFILVFAAASHGELLVAVPDGYATQNGGTTGGGNATPVTVSTAAAFKTAIGDTTPRVIIVQGRIDLGGSVSVRSNKTIVGADTSSGLYGGTVGVGGTNYIFQNLTFGPSAGDVMEVSGATNVFIHKCEFYGSTDELCSIVRQADYVTVSWCKFYFPNPDSHSFGSLIGNRDDATSDRGKLNVTMHHNWYAEGVRGRMPRVRFGHVHIYNNFYNSVGNGYCIGIGYECHIRLENAHFEDVSGPWADYGGTSNGEIGWTNLKFVGCSEPGFMPNVYTTIFTPPYPYTLDNVNNVKSFVTDPTYGAGNRLSLNDTTPPTPDPMTWATAPYGANETSITMVATTADDASGAEYFFDCTAGGGHDSGWQNSTTYTDTGLTMGTIYSYQVKARDKSAYHNETGFSGTASASPTADTMAPTPDPMTWASAPAATGIDTIAMTATTATDVSGVEYYFTCTAGGGHDSGWQNGTSYTDTGLTNNTTYAYTVVARDKSAGQNATGESDEASATTLRFICTAPPAMDFNADCKVDFMDYATIAGAWGEAPGVVVELITNGDFAAGLSGWNTSIANPTLVQITSDAGTAKLTRTVSDATAPNGNYLYQVIPVVSGQEYELNAEWKGDLTGTDRQWAEVYVGFVATGTIPPSAFGSIMYKKATYGGPNATPMPWDWESILLSPNTSPVPPAGGIFTATDNYMVVAFNLGGRANAGTCYYNVDNISVVGSTPCPSMDLNDDCAFDWLDIEKFVADWLACNRNPGSECWQ